MSRFQENYFKIWKNTNTKVVEKIFRKFFLHFSSIKSIVVGYRNHRICQGIDTIGYRYYCHRYLPLQNFEHGLKSITAVQTAMVMSQSRTALQSRSNCSSISFELLFNNIRIALQPRSNRSSIAFEPRCVNVAYGILSALVQDSAHNSGVK